MSRQSKTYGPRSGGQAVATQKTQFPAIRINKTMQEIAEMIAQNRKSQIVKDLEARNV